jgi:hypothetical protein
METNARGLFSPGGICLQGKLVRQRGKSMNRHLLHLAIYCLCILMPAFAPTARSQDKSDAVQQTDDISGKPPEKGQKKGKQDTPVDVQGAQVATDATPAAAANADELRKEAQNPIASLISVPLQENFNFDIGPADRTQNILNIQPVIPVSLSKDWNLIVRWIAPVVYQPLPIPQTSGPPAQSSGVYGLGDMNPSFFFSPKKKYHGLIWGIGPTFVLPTATNTAYLGQGKLSMGPTVVALVQPAHWTIGLLANNVWSVAGQSDANKPAVNQFLLQYFINYNLKKGWYIPWAPIMTANWEAPSGNQWVVPVGGGIGRIMKLGFQPVNITAQFYRNVVYPTGTSPWTMKLQFVLLFPKLTKKQEEMMMEQKLKQMQQEQSQNP